MNWEALEQEVLAICDEEETIRVLEEFELFEQRNWQNYVLFCIELLSKLSVWDNGSVKDSYVIRKYLKKNKDDSWLNHKRSKDILFSDAFRLNVEVIAPSFYLLEKLREVETVFENTISQFDFYRKEKITAVNSEILVLSDKEINDEEFDIIINEKKESSIEEIELLRSVLIVYISARAGI